MGFTWEEQLLEAPANFRSPVSFVELSSLGMVRVCAVRGWSELQMETRSTIPADQLGIGGRNRRPGNGYAI
jgi:hypothetical protein